MHDKINVILDKLVSAIAFTIGSFHLLNVSGLFVLSTPDVRIFHLMMMMAILFMTKPTLKRLQGNFYDRITSLILVVAALASSVYLLTRWKDIAMSGGETVALDAWVGLLVLVLVLEGARRGVGLALALICLVFFTYPFYSAYLPGVLEGRGYSPLRLSEMLTTTSQGLYGIPIGVSATYIVLFTIYGAFLSEFGAGDFFFTLSNRITRGTRAAGAKTAVLFSTLLGMISGSAAGNVAVTGTLTIPMMKREGYKSHQAGAIEAVVSTGGQIMPPVMGAAAFIMAEIVGTPYTNIMKVGLFPALLFFASIFFVVHMQAVKSDITSAPYVDDGQPLWMVLLKGGQYIIPFVTLVGLMIYGYSPFKASFMSILLLLGCDIIWKRRLDLEFFQKSARAITHGAKSVVPIAVACAAAGIIAGTLGMTGLGSKISGLILTTSGGIPVFALVLTMIVAIILGMGLPTTAAYLILATVVAPALAEVGVPLLTAHMFVFFYGCVSTITPPVALASYVAAGIAGADINKVGWTAFAYGITSYILPFMFFFGPGLMLQGEVVDIVLAIASGFVGVFCISAFVIGCLKYELEIWQRGIMAVAGISLLHQGLPTDLVGLGLLALIVVIDRRKTKS
ncbi:MAG: TRAP transporter fused permease subunit [Rhodospirillales bacterium]|jgi:TRAP transporter 4TM/12TM fusion protein|nr:TRAP transporter fused permease subunit [Rhodospirillales bacterium]